MLPDFNGSKAFFVLERRIKCRYVVIYVPLGRLTYFEKQNESVRSELLDMLLAFDVITSNLRGLNRSDERNFVE